MAYPYDYDCECRLDDKYGYLQGRQSELLFNGERHDIYEAVKHLIDYPSDATATPTAKHRGSLWYDQRTNQLYTWVGLGYKHDRVRNGWLPVSTDKFQVTDEILNDTPSANPVTGQLWIFNGTMLYWTGTNWEPVRALTQSDSQFNMSAFDNFRIYSPLNQMGSAVVSDLELEAQMELQRKYKNGEYSLDSSSMARLIERWNLDTNVDVNDIIDFDMSDVSYQYLVPNIEVDKVFIDGRLDTNYIKQSNSVIQYKRSYLLDEQDYWDDDTPLINHIKKPSLVHLSAGRLSNITKRLFKVDRSNPKIMCPAANTEYYGYTIGDIRGHFLIPTKDASDAIYQYKQLINSMNETNKEALVARLKDMGYELDTQFIEKIQNIEGDYVIQKDGIYLSYEASEQYDYILAITYEFSWINSTGTMTQTDNRTGSSTYYIPQRLGSMNVFVNGFDYEDSYYTWDSKSTTLTLAEDVANKENMDVSVFGVFAHEYGFIREMNIASDNKSARISTIHRFLHPLIFVNGEVLNRSSWQYFDKILLEETERPGTNFTIHGVHRDMSWTVIDMQKEVHTYDEKGAIVSTEVVDICINDNGYIDDSDDFVDSYGNRAIPIPKDISIMYERSDNYRYKRPFVVLFVNGLMVKREDIYYDQAKHMITCEGLQPGMTYVLLNDTEEQLYNESNGVLPAISVGKIDNSLVYLNGYLLNEPESYLYHGDEGFATSTAMHGEIRAFNNGTTWKVFNATKANAHNNVKGKWDTLADDTKNEIKSFSDSYVNANSSVSFIQDVVQKEDNVIVFGYKLANYIESPLTPVTCWLHTNDRGAYFIKEAGCADEYIKLVQDERDSNVYINKIDPANPDTLANYHQNNILYYQFLYRAFQLWLKDTELVNNVTLTLEQKIQLYKEAGKSEPDKTLSGDFYDGVYMRTKSDEDTFIDLRDNARGTTWANKVFIGKDYNPQTDYIMVWLNGIRQYPTKDYVIELAYDKYNRVKGYNIILGHYESADLIETVDSDGYVEMPRGVGKGHDLVGIDKEPLTGMLTYIIQRAENGSQSACRYTILDHNNCISGANNIYTTRDMDPSHVDPVSFVRDTSYDFALYPGNVTIYADGIRLPRESYRILDNYTILINSTELFIGSKDSYPTQNVLNINHEIESIRHLQPEQLLVEVREDSKWTERSVTTNNSFNGEFNVYTTGSTLPVTILDTQDTILMFVDGLYYGLTLNDGYVIDKTLGAIILKDASVYNAIKTEELETYLVQQKGLEDYYTKELAAYRKKHLNNVHTITLEWR